MARRKHRSKRDRSPLLHQELAIPEHQQLLEEAQLQLARNKPERALPLLEKIPSRFHSQPEFLYARGMAQHLQGNFYAALDDLEEILRGNPGFYPAYAGLTAIYVQLDLSRHAWQSAERFLQHLPEDQEVQGKGMSQVIATARDHWQEVSTQFNVPLDTLAQAALPHEKAQLELRYGNYEAALTETERAIRLVPGWAAPQNNRSLPLFFLGRTEEAVAAAQQVLSSEADNLHALSNLVLFYAATGEREKAASYVAEIDRLLVAKPLAEVDLPKVIESLGIAEADQVLERLAVHLASFPQDTLGANEWYALGAAAANTGHLPEAERLLNKALAAGSRFLKRDRQTLKAIKQARRNHQALATGPGPQGRFPYTHFTQIVHSKIATELFEKLAEQRDPDHWQAHLKEIIQRYPFLLGALRLILWYEGDETLWNVAVDLLSLSDDQFALAELKSYATSQQGSDDQRMRVLAALNRASQLNSGEEIRFWLQERGEWSIVTSQLSQIGPTPLPACKPRALELVEKAGKIFHSERPDRLERVISYLEQALQIDPDCAIALHNLGSFCLMKGEMGRGESLIRRSVEVAPDYLFARATLAEIEYQHDNLEACEAHLQRIFTAPVISLDVMERAFVIKFYLSLQKDDLEEARSVLHSLEELNPEHQHLERLKEDLDSIEGDLRFYNRWLENVHRYRQRQLSRPISAEESLADCLNRITREALAASLRAWDQPSAGRKAEVIERLVKALTNREWLDFYINYQLSQEEWKALLWVLAGEGVRPWSEFTARFGDDFDESPYWQYHEPETIPGRLRMLGLLAVGTYAGQTIALIPLELRPLLPEFAPDNSE